MAVVNDEMLGQVLEAVVAAGGVSESVPSVEGLTREQGLEIADELIARGWLMAKGAEPGRRQIDVGPRDPDYARRALRVG